MENQESIVDKIEKVVLSKIKLPIVSTYIIVLLIYNWQIILYLIFKDQEIEAKIKYLIDNHHNNYFWNIFIPIIISFIYTLLFPILQVGINLSFSFFKKKNSVLNRNEELENAFHAFELQRNLTGQQTLERLQNNIDLLTNENQKLLADNKNLIERLKEENLKDENSNNFKKSINLKREKELRDICENIVNKYSQFNDNEKSAFLDIINFFDATGKALSADSVQDISLNHESSELPLNLLQEANIIIQVYTGFGYEYRTSPLGFDILEFLKENYSQKL